jgi:zinc protease
MMQKISRGAARGLAIGPVVVLATACAAGTPAPATSPQARTVVDRAVMPAEGPTPSYDFPDVKRRRLSNGLELWIVERPGVPLVNLSLVVGAGAVADPDDRPGLASLTAAMMTEGTTTRTAAQIADEIDFLPANLSATAVQEFATVSLGTLARNLEPALAVFADIIVNPSFPDSEWRRVRDQRLVSLRQSRDQPTTIATQEFGRRLYGPAHPLGRPIQGTTASVSSTTARALADFHRMHYRPNNANLIVVGDVDADRVTAQLERAFAGWASQSISEARQVTDPEPQGGSRLYLIDRPGAAQSEIRIGHVGVARTHRDYFPLLVMNTLLGGQFTSRINLNLREDKGYTYGARSAFTMGRIAGPFTASAGVETSVTRESIVEFMRELTEIRSQRPATDAEVDFARTSIIRREPLTLETNQQIASRVQDLILYGLPLDYFDEFGRRLAAVTTSDVNRVAREYLQPDRMAIVVVGDRARIEAQLRQLPYPVEVVVVEIDTEEATQQGR